ncbi:hypothetical protein V6U77_28410 [Micromonospora sp. CPCC 205546]|uniref:hypothetical protein n=1 Tax=Micromonospora sp. CPCC 205546 TaxID=3122397 RepID=UPI002FEEC898
MPVLALNLEEVDFRSKSGSGGPIAGRVWFIVGEIAFPELGWCDFPASVWCSAVEAFSELSQGANEAFSYFFDGPYYLYFKKSSISGDVIEVEASTDRAGVPELLASTSLRLNELRTALLRPVESSAITLLVEAGDPVIAQLVAYLRATEV